MNIHQRNKLAMFKSVDQVFDQYTESVSKIPALSKSAGNLKTMISKIENDFGIQESLKGVITNNKSKEQSAVAKTASLVAGILSSYAHEEGLINLETKMNISHSKLANMPDEKMETQCKNILNTGREYLNETADHGMTNKILNKLESQINSFTGLIPQPRNKVITLSQSTRELKNTIDEVNELLKKRTDKLMMLFEESEPLFYNTYKSARIIVDRRGPRNHRNNHTSNGNTENVDE
ncbi:hypothetical protein [Carboxylicivirga linearis]|uniref:Uncharacterized protein n=1 Tax=Carboxylicivirga linearis TaxID=1628157 RepID=A0ABS5JX96_9BACT|nr:hypothetical protein [Carboxylicivirga linearis]MBS2099513.1 hypothetical protein [Carboxylicivirga linearis]